MIHSSRPGDLRNEPGNGLNKLQAPSVGGAIPKAIPVPEDTTEDIPKAIPAPTDFFCYSAYATSNLRAAESNSRNKIPRILHRFFDWLSFK